MTSDQFYGETPKGHALLAELGRKYELGDKTALLDAISISNATDTGLPDWAADELSELVCDRWKGKLKTWKGTKQPLKSGYKKLLGNYVRAQVFSAVTDFFENKHSYKRMPTVCIQAWYDGKLEIIPENNDGAVEIANMALAKTAFGAISFETFEDQMSFKPDNDAYREARAFVASQGPNKPEADLDELAVDFFRELLALPLSFGERESEVLFGLREPGQFWGPPRGDPPDWVRKLLEAD